MFLVKALIQNRLHIDGSVRKTKGGKKDEDRKVKMRRKKKRQPIPLCNQINNKTPVMYEAIMYHQAHSSIWHKFSPKL